MYCQLSSTKSVIRTETKYWLQQNLQESSESYQFFRIKVALQVKQSRPPVLMARHLKQVQSSVPNRAVAKVMHEQCVVEHDCSLQGKDPRNSVKHVQGIIEPFAFLKIIQNQVSREQPAYHQEGVHENRTTHYWRTGMRSHKLKTQL